MLERHPLWLKQAALLKGSRFTVVALSEIENNRMSMELWRGITVDRAGGVMLEFRDDKFACGFCWMVPANPRLRVSLQFVQGNSDTLAVGCPDAMVASYQCR
jgi:hypothetical protein